MNFYQVRQYTKFPFKNQRIDRLIQSFETLTQAQNFSIAYNTRRDKYGKYIVPSTLGYYVCEVQDPQF